MTSKDLMYRIKSQNSIWALLLLCASVLAMLITSAGTIVLAGVFFLLFIFALSHKYRISLSLIFFYLGTLLISLTTFRVGGQFFNGSDVFYIISALLLIGSTVGTHGDLYGQFIKNNPLFTPLLIFLFGAVLSMLNSDNTIQALIATGKYAFLFGIWLPVGISLLDNVNKTKWLIILLVVASMLPIVTCLSDYFLRTKMTFYLDQLLNLNLKTPLPTRSARFGSVMDHPNNFAMFLTVVFPIALFCTFSFKSIFLRFCGLIYLILVFTSIFISGSRGCLLAIIVEFVLFGYLMIKEGRLSPSTIMTMAIMITCSAMYVVFQESLGLFPQSPVARIKEMLAYDIMSYRADVGRIESIRQALSYILKYPITGIGVEYVAPATKALRAKLFVTNTFLRLWASLGIFGLFSCVLFYTKPLLTGFRRIYDVSFTDLEVRNMMGILLCSIIGSIVIDMVQPQFHNRVKWIFVICLFSLCKQGKSNWNDG